MYFVSNINPKKQVKTSIESCHFDRLLLRVSRGHQTPSSPYLPIHLSCRLTGLSDPIHHVCDNLTEAIDWERGDECSPVSPGLLWLMRQPLAPRLWPSPFETVDVQARFLLSSHTLERLPGWQCSLEDTALHMHAIASHQGADHEVEIYIFILYIKHHIPKRRLVMPYSRPWISLCYPNVMKSFIFTHFP